MKDHAETMLTNEPQDAEDLPASNDNNTALHDTDGTSAAQSAATTSVIVKTYDSDSDSEKPILLELGAATTNANTRASNSDLPLVPPYPPEYPLDMHLNSYNVASASHYQISATDVPSNSYTTLYSNPYLETISSNNHLALPSGGLPSLTSSLLPSASYVGHIPQTVYTWSTATTQSANLGDSSAIDMASGEPPTELVPAPMYMGYTEAPEHLISKEMNPSWKDKVMQSEKDYKKTACDRERTRMRDMNRAFDLLRSKLPISKPNGKKYSKIESLRIAINYINHLQQCLIDAESSSIDCSSQNMHQNAVEYLRELSMRRRSQAYRYENRKSRSSSYEDTNDKESIDESQQHTTWNDNFIGNTSKDKWD